MVSDKVPFQPRRREVKIDLKYRYIFIIQPDWKLPTHILTLFKYSLPNIILAICWSGIYRFSFPFARCKESAKSLTVVSRLMGN
jgi:hypothetical protein